LFINERGKLSFGLVAWEIMLEVQKQCFWLRELQDKVLRLWTTSFTRGVESRCKNKRRYWCVLV